MSVQSEIKRISDGVILAKQAILNKGVKVPENSKVDDLAALIGSIGVNFRSGTSEPENSLGEDGDWYLVLEEE